MEDSRCNAPLPTIYFISRNGTDLFQKAADHLPFFRIVSGKSGKVVNQKTERE
jgi:hypothetical protein